MLRWSVTFFIVAIVTALLGFGNLATGAESIAKIVFYIFFVLFALSVMFDKTLDRS
jgi:uncharacterized membrane protein YtjA (UPF0391 family)